MDVIIPDWGIKLLQKKYKLLEPFDERYLGPNGYDLRLGPQVTILEPIEEPVRVTRKELKQRSRVIDISTTGFELKPKQFALFSTLEYIRVPRFLVAIVWNRSSLARLGIRVRGDAGFIDSGFEGVIALEVYNDSENTYIFHTGDKIAQVVFHLTLPCLTPYRGVYKGQKSWEIMSRGV